MDTNQRLNSKDSKFNITSTVNTFKRYWWIYAASLVVFLGLAAFYLKVKAPVYAMHATIILNEDDDLGKSNLGGLGSLMSTSSLGGSGYKYVEDEILRLTSHTNFMELVNTLNLNYTYSSKKSFFSKKKFYYKDTPLEVFIPSSVLDTITTSTNFKIKVAPDGHTADIKVKQAKGKVVYDKNNVSLPAMVKTPYGTFRVSLTKEFKPGQPLNMIVGVNNPASTADELARNLTANTPSKKSSIIFFDYEDPNIDRGVDVIDNLVEIYNNRGAEELRRQAGVSVEFIKSRLEKLYTELEASEKNIETYKRDNKIVDAAAEAEYIFMKKQAVETGVIEYETRASVLKMIIDFLRSDNNRYSLIPFAGEMPKEPLEEYNKLVMERMRLQEQAKGNNSTLRTISAQIDAMRTNLLTSLERELAATNIAVSDMKRNNAGTSSRISDYPTMEKDLLALYRDQKIKNQIYAYLLQKLEESELKLARDIRAGKSIDKAYPDVKPAKPNKIMVVLLAAVGSVAFAYCLTMALGILKGIIKRRRALKKEELED